MKKFSEFATKTAILDGDKIKIDKILNKEIEVLNFKISDSKQKHNEKCLTLQFKLDGENRVLFSGSSVLIHQCEEYKDEMPFLATIKQIDKYYSFT